MWTWRVQLPCRIQVVGRQWMMSNSASNKAHIGTNKDISTCWLAFISPFENFFPLPFYLLLFSVSIRVKMRLKKKW